jgi:hypothetical protein
MSYCQKLLNKDYVISLNSVGLHQFESYLVQLPYDLRKAYCNCRCLNHRLPIEKGRFWGVKRDHRICDLCVLEHIGYEFHYLFECKYF